MSINYEKYDLVVFQFSQHYQRLRQTSFVLEENDKSMEHKSKERVWENQNITTITLAVSA